MSQDISLKTYLSGRIFQEVLLAVVLSILLMLGLSIWSTSRGFSTLQDELGHSLQQGHDQTQRTLQQNVEQVSRSVESTQSTVTRDVSQYLKQSIEEEMSQVQTLLRDSLISSAEVLTETLAEVSSEAILSRNFASLVSFVKVANRNPKVVYAVYLRPEGQPYTRYLNQTNPLIGSLTQAGQGATPLDRVRHAAAGDRALHLIHRDVVLEGKILGKVELCISLDSVNQSITAMQQRYQGLIAKSTSTINQVLGREGTQLLGYLRENFRQVDNSHVASSGQVATQIQKTAADQRWTQGFLISLAGLLAIFGLSWFLVRQMFHPMHELHLAMRNIASGNGDLTHRLLVTQGTEIGQVADAFNAFVRKVEQIVSQIAISAAHLGELSSYLEGAAAHTNEGMSRQQQEAAQIALAINQMAVTVHGVAESTQQAAQSARHADEQASHGRKAMSSINSEINALVSEVAKASEVVQRVEEDTIRISTVLDVIRGIAEQTNLLALNAAIEAARAGEQGRGFAVVADEVRSLAQRTQQSTQEIQAMILSLEQGVRATVNVMHLSRERAAESVNRVNVAGQTLGAITDAVDTITAMNNQIATASREQSNVTEEINRNIVHITEVATLTAKDAANTANATKRLTGMIDELMQIVHQFQLSHADINVLDTAKAAHLGWKMRLEQFLDGYGTMSRNEAIDHEHCKFGKWYSAVGKVAYNGIPEIHDIDQPHRELHQMIGRIMTLKEQGAMKEAQQGLQRVGELSTRLVQLIDRVKEKIEH